jgi:hypothetical protein
MAKQNTLTSRRRDGWNYGGMEDAMLDGNAVAEKIKAA